MKPHLSTFDIIIAGTDVIDAQQRDDGLIEAIIDTSEQDEYDSDETLVFYRGDLNRHGQPIQDLTIDGAEMFKYNKKLDIWFHSSKTLQRIASAKKRDKKAVDPVDSQNASQ
jgi:hypothetical protein